MNRAEVDPTAKIEKTATVGVGTWIGANVQICEGAHIGNECRIHKNAYVGSRVTIGNRTKIQNDASLFEGVVLKEGVFIGPHVCFTNDKVPRSINPDGTLKKNKDWKITETLVGRGASIGANATVVCGVAIGDWAMVGAGAVVTKDVPAHGLVLGNPAQLCGHVCRCGHRLSNHPCTECGTMAV